jgi:hypothetical protein
MAILSSTKQPYFARIASLERVGVYRVTEELLMQQDHNAASAAAGNVKQCTRKVKLSFV